MKEKPQTPEEVLSLYSIIDRCVLPSEIFEILERTQPGIGGEIQLTDAMREIAVTDGMTAVEFEGRRYDMGNKFGILQAQIEVGLEQLNYKDDEDKPLEYTDYINNPTMSNASDLISRLAEELLFNEAGNLIEYAAKRPGAYKVGEHGLFSSYPDVDLDRVAEEISTHDGNIWTDILSLRREDADRLGYDCQKLWK